jgi:hypothetical protein
MPNWCSNNLRITSKDPAKIQKLKDAWDSGRFMQTLYPCPEDLIDTIAGSYSDDEKQKELEAKEQANLEKYGYKNWYDWCVANWGTKWDINADSFDSYVKGDTFYAVFDTAWSPPIEFFMYLDGRNRAIEDEEIDENDYDIVCDYEEEGMGFMGTYSTEYGEETSKIEYE